MFASQQTRPRSYCPWNVKFWNLTITLRPIEIRWKIIFGKMTRTKYISPPKTKKIGEHNVNFWVFLWIVPKTILELAAKKITEELNLFTVKIKKKNQMTKFRSYLKKIQNCMTNTVISVFQYIVCFPFLCSNIQAAPVYGVYISQLVRYRELVTITLTFWTQPNC